MSTAQEEALKLVYSPQEGWMTGLKLLHIVEGLIVDRNKLLTENNRLRAKLARIESSLYVALADPEEPPMPKPEPKPVVTLETLGDPPADYLRLDGAVAGNIRLNYRFRPWRFKADFSAAELRAIADWLDQWQVLQGEH